MKKYLLRSGFFGLLVFSITAVYLSCTDETAMSFDLTGSWSGWGQSNGGGGHVELLVNQDTTGNVTGFVYTFDEKMDTVPFVGTLRDRHFTGTGYSACRPTISLDVMNDGMKMTGTAQDLDSATCNTETVALLFYKVVPATIDITGSWNGTHVGTDGTGSFLMVISQSGAAVTGNIYDTNDTTAVYGRVLGNVFEGIVDDQMCPVLFYMEVDGNKMSGPFMNTGNSFECTDRGTVTANRVTVKQNSK